MPPELRQLRRRCPQIWPRLAIFLGFGHIWGGLRLRGYFFNFHKSLLQRGFRNSRHIPGSPSGTETVRSDDFSRSGSKATEVATTNEAFSKLECNVVLQPAPSGGPFSRLIGRILVPIQHACSGARNPLLIGSGHQSHGCDDCS